MDIIKEKTSELRSNYLEWLTLHKRGGDLTGATLFVSHAWNGLFLDLVAALEHSYAKDTFHRFWIDIFTVPQNDEDRPMNEDDPNSLYEAIDEILVSIGSIVVVLTPFDHPAYLNRIWCLYELYFALEEDLRIAILLPPRERRRLLSFLTFGGNPRPLYRRINAAAAVSGKAEDRERLIARMRQNEPGAVRRLDIRVAAHLSTWLQREALAAYDAAPPDHRRGGALQRRVAEALAESGRFPASLATSPRSSPSPPSAAARGPTQPPCELRPAPSPSPFPSQGRGDRLRPVPSPPLEMCMMTLACSLRPSPLTPSKRLF